MRLSSAFPVKQPNSKYVRTEQPLKFNPLYNNGIQFSGNSEAERLHQLANRGNPEDIVKISRLLIKNPSVINHQDVQGNTALMQAAFKNHDAIVNVLLKQGADATLKNQYDDTALMRAATVGNFAISKALIEHLKKNRQPFRRIVNDEGNTALHLAVEKGNLNLVKLLLDNGLNANHRNQNKEFPITIARQNGLHTIADLLKQYADRPQLPEWKEPAGSDYLPNRFSDHFIHSTNSSDTKVTTITHAEAQLNNIQEILKDPIGLGETVDIHDPDMQATIVEQYKLATGPEKETNKNKLAILWSKLNDDGKEEQANFWNHVIKQVYKYPVQVIGGFGGLHRIVGMEAQKKELEAQVIGPLAYRDPQPTSFLVLHGPPGTGKTFYADCIADHLDYELMPVNYSDIAVNDEGRAWYGETSARIRDRFNKASEKGQVVLFFDEAERFLGKRTANRNNGASQETSEFITCVNDLIKHNETPENFDKRVLTIAALNNLEHVDTAAYRPMRTHTMEVLPCGIEDKKEIIRNEIEKYDFSSKVNQEHLTDAFIQCGVDMAPADIKAVFSAAEKFARHRHREADDDSQNNEIETVDLGLALQRVINTKRKMAASSQNVMEA